MIFFVGIFIFAIPVIVFGCNKGRSQKRLTEKPGYSKNGADSTEVDRMEENEEHRATSPSVLVVDVGKNVIFGKNQKSTTLKMMNVSSTRKDFKVWCTGHDFSVSPNKGFIDAGAIANIRLTRIGAESVKKSKVRIEYCDAGVADPSELELNEEQYRQRVDVQIDQKNSESVATVPSVVVFPYDALKFGKNDETKQLILANFSAARKSYWKYKGESATGFQCNYSESGFIAPYSYATLTVKRPHITNTIQFYLGFADADTTIANGVDAAMEKAEKKGIYAYLEQ